MELTTNPNMTVSHPDMQSLESAIEQFVIANWVPADAEAPILEPLAGDGSTRRFVRVRSGVETAIAVWGPDPSENRAYEMIGRHLWRLGRLGPEFLGCDQGAGLFLIEDLGDVPLADWAGRESDWGQGTMYGRTVALMADLHHRGLDGFDPDWCFQTRQYDRALILERETGYFLNAFVIGYLGQKTDADNLASEFDALAEKALAGTETVLMHRDFQSRNVMIKNGWPRLIDFQGARLGPPGYDLASLLYDPYAELEPKRRKAFSEYYVERRIASQPDFNEDRLFRSLPYLAASRLLQALGAYGYLTRVQKKPWFEKHIPAALRNLREILDETGFDFMPALRALINRAAEATGVV